MSPEEEAALEAAGWERPWSDQWRTWQREAALMHAPRLARSVARALQTLGCEVSDLEVELGRAEPEDEA